MTVENETTTPDETTKLARHWVSRDGDVVELENVDNLGSPTAIVLVIHLPKQVDFYIVTGENVTRGAIAPWRYEVGPAGELSIYHETANTPRRLVRIYAPHYWHTMTTDTKVEYAD